MTYLVLTIAIIGFILMRTLFRPSPLQPPAAAAPPSTAIAPPRPRKVAQPRKHVISIDAAHHTIVIDDADPSSHGRRHPDALAAFYHTLYSPGLCSPK